MGMCTFESTMQDVLHGYKQCNVTDKNPIYFEVANQSTNFLRKSGTSKSDSNEAQARPMLQTECRLRS